MNTKEFLSQIKVTRTKNTYETYRVALESIKGMTPLQYIGKYKGHLSDTTIKHRLIIYGELMRYNGIDNKRAFDLIRSFKVNTKEERCPTDEEISMIKQNCTGKYLLALLLMSECGLRVSEVAGLTKEDLGEGYVILRNTKNHTTVKQMISKDTADALQYFEPFGTTQAIQKYFSRLTKKLGIAEVHCHSFRRWYINRLVRSGVGITIVKAAARHKAISSTMRYVNTEESQVKEAVANVF